MWARDDKPTTYDVELDHAFVWRCQPCRRSFTVSNEWSSGLSDFDLEVWPPSSGSGAGVHEPRQCVYWTKRIESLPGPWHRGASFKPGATMADGGSKCHDPSPLALQAITLCPR